MGRWPLLFSIALVIAGLIFIAFLGRSVDKDLQALSVARNDDVSWNMSQLEVELLRMQYAVLEARTKDAGETAALRAVRTRFDIFYSRVNSLPQGDAFRAALTDPTVRDGLAQANQFLQRNVPVVDGADADLRAGLPMLLMDISALRPVVRQMALIGIQNFAQDDAARRQAFSVTLMRLAASVLALICALLALVALLVRLYRQGQRISRDSARARARFEAAVQSSLDAVLVVDTDGRILEFNGAAETVFGYSRAEALGAEMADLIVPEHLRAAHRDGMARYLATNEQKVIGAGRVRLEGLRKSGDVFPVELSISLSEAGGRRVFVSFLRDITHEIEAEEAMRAARDKAQENEKAKSDLLTVMSHEMRTPLNGILGSLSLIQREGLSARQLRHLDSIAVSGELLLSHVNDVLDLSSLDAESSPHKEEVFDLFGTIHSLMDSLTANARAQGNQLKTCFLSDFSDPVRGQRTALQQCLVNLVGNAIKFTRDGAVQIEVEQGQADLVEIRVSDTGVGISEENLDRIFDEFVMVDTDFNRKNAGTGLGLAITKRLIERMGGTLEVDSILGEGSLFILSLPLPRMGAHDAGAKARETALPDIPPGQRALVVDDNEINRRILRDMLEDLGLEVAEAESGYAALDQLQHSRFHVAFLDISMPGVDGIETLHRMRALPDAGSDLPAIAVTAHAALRDHQNILQAPFSGLLVKPVTPRGVQQKLAEALGLATMFQECDEVNPAQDYIARFGQAEYDSALATLFDHSVQLFQEAAKSPDPSQIQRDTAHQLAGSAAILGRPDLREVLQLLERCPAGDWPTRCSDLLERVDRLQRAVAPNS